ncbi:MAG: type II secretion system protein GspG [Opitutae bacterium]|nr:type II secretion system protein GspG [Opitutae bacterium]MCD8298847.1 type II secretion system protein GspG [Opitutae bacterium]
MNLRKLLNHKRARARSAFTLLEIIIVIALIAIIVGAVSTNLGGIFSDNQKKLTQTDIQSLETPLFAYQLKHGSYPTTDEGLAALVQSGELKKIPEDPWKRPFQYRYPGEKNKDGYDIWSYGPDGIDSDDDIGNWDL